MAFDDVLRWCQHAFTNGMESSGKQPVPVGCTLERLTAAILCGHQLTVPFHVGSWSVSFDGTTVVSVMVMVGSGRDSVWLLWEPKAPGQVLHHQVASIISRQMDLAKIFSLHIQ